MSAHTADVARAATSPEPLPLGVCFMLTYFTGASMTDGSNVTTATNCVQPADSLALDSGRSWQETGLVACLNDTCSDPSPLEWKFTHVFQDKTLMTYLIASSVFFILIVISIAVCACICVKKKRARSLAINTETNDLNIRAVPLPEDPVVGNGTSRNDEYSHPPDDHGNRVSSSYYVCPKSRDGISSKSGSLNAKYAKPWKFRANNANPAGYSDDDPFNADQYTTLVADSSKSLSCHGNGAKTLNCHGNNATVSLSEDGTANDGLATYTNCRVSCADNAPQIDGTDLFKELNEEDVYDDTVIEFPDPPDFLRLGRPAHFNAYEININSDGESAIGSTRL